MILKIINIKSVTKEWLIKSVTNTFQAVSGNKCSLYNFWFELDSPEMAKDVFSHISCVNTVFGDRPISLTITDDKGNESDNLIPCVNNIDFKAGINQNSDPIVYMELRDRFRDMEVRVSNEWK